MNITIIILLLIVSYLIGSIPGGYLLTKLLINEDIRDHGSNSTGATNTTRVLGIKGGLAAALIDITKGMVVMAILKIFKLEQFYILTISNTNINIITLYGLAAIIGHIYPIYLNFRGGKAVATSIGIVIFMTPWIGLLGFGYFFLLLYLTRYVSITSMTGAFLIFLTALVMYLTKSTFIPVSIETVITYILLVIIIVIRHIPNIKRLINKEEPRVGGKKH